MIEVVPNAGTVVSNWVARKVNLKGFGPNVAFGMYEGDELVGGVVFSEYREQDIVFSGAIDRAGVCSKRVLRQLFYYPFGQLKCHRISAYTEVDNRDAVRFLRRLGFTKEGRVRECSSNGKDAFIYGMLRRECSWLGD